MPFEFDGKAQQATDADSGRVNEVQRAHVGVAGGVNGHPRVRQAQDQPASAATPTHQSGLMSTISYGLRRDVATAEMGEAARERVLKFEELRALLLRNPDLKRAFELMFELGLR